MAWDDEKEDLDERPDVPDGKKLSAEEWNEHVEDQKSRAESSHGNEAHDPDMATAAEVEEKADSPHDLAGDDHDPDTLSNLNQKIEDATLDDEGDARPPEAHGETHESGGDDSLDVEALGTEGAAGTAPVSQGDGTLSMEEVGGNGNGAAFDWRSENILPDKLRLNYGARELIEFFDEFETPADDAEPDDGTLVAGIYDRTINIRFDSMSKATFNRSRILASRLYISDSDQGDISDNESAIFAFGAPGENALTFFVAEGEISYAILSDGDVVVPPTVLGPISDGVYTLVAEMDVESGESYFDVYDDDGAELYSASEDEILTGEDDAAEFAAGFSTVVNNSPDFGVGYVAAAQADSDGNY